MIRLLLLQVREPSDDMLVHERECVRARLGTREYELRTRTALLDVPDASWLADADALIIGGSGAFSVHDPRSERWVSGLRRVLDAALTGGVPTFGICFGHQLLGLHLGAGVVTEPAAAERGTIQVAATEAAADDPVFGSLGGSYRVHTGHSDSVPEVPPGVALLGSTDACRSQVFRVDGAPCWTVQYHPDLGGADARDRYLAFAQHLAPEQAAMAREHARLFDPTCGDTDGLLGRFVDYVAEARGSGA